MPATVPANHGTRAGSARTGPLTDYLASLARTGTFTAEEALPAHEYRFRGLGLRSAALVAHHRDRSTEIMHVIDRLGQPTAWTIATQLTWSRGWAALHGVMRRMALAETVAHLHYLAATGKSAAPRAGRCTGRGPAPDRRPARAGPG